MSRPWMPFYVADYRADTAHLGAAEHGAYVMLILHYWTTGGLPTDDKQLARIACMSPREWSRARNIIKAFFHDGWQHKRIDKELAHATEVSSKRREAVNQRKSNPPSNDTSIDPSNDDTRARASPSPSPKESKKAADAASKNGKYFFETGVIRLTEESFRQWEESFNRLDLKAELLGLSQWAQSQKDWYFAVSGALAKRNREIGVKLQQGKIPDRAAVGWDPRL